MAMTRRSRSYSSLSAAPWASPERLGGACPSSVAKVKDMACTSPIKYDSDSLVVIDKDRLGHYEDANKTMEVRQSSSEPQAWSIQSLLNVGGDGYDTPISEIFVLGGRKLGIAGTDGVRVYQKCD